VAEVMADQAAGLRRLISRDFVRVIAITSVRSDPWVSFLAFQLSAAIGALGREVCLLDGAATGTVTRMPSHAGQAISPLAPKQLMQWLIAAQGDGQKLAEQLERARGGAENVLVAIPRATGARQARLASCAPDVILLIPPALSELQDAYALIKRILSVSGKCRLHVLVDDCAEPEYAKRIFCNLSRTTDKFLSQKLEFLGDLPRDDRFRQVHARDIPFHSDPHSPVARMLRALAEHILLWPFPGENDMTGYARRLVAALPAPPAY